MRGTILAVLVAIAHGDAQFTVPVFSDHETGHFDVEDSTHVYAHHGHSHAHDHALPHHPSHTADDDNVDHEHNYIPIRIIRDCVGNFGPEPKKCVCSATEIGFAQNTCEAGQACYPDGGCRDMQKVSCSVYQEAPGTAITVSYGGDEKFAKNGIYEFQDVGPDTSLSFELRFMNGAPSAGSVGNCGELLIRIKCTAAAGPFNGIDLSCYPGGRISGDRRPVLSADCSQDEMPGAPVIATIVLQPYITASEASCARASSEEICNGMRAIGARCCYDYEAARCTYDEECYYRSGPVAVTSRNFVKEIFGDSMITVRGFGDLDDYDDNDGDGDDGGNTLLGLARTLANLVN